MREPAGAGGKLAAIVAATLFVVAQPQMLCALHCMAFHHPGDMDGMEAVVAAHHPVATPCGHGFDVITAPTVPVAGVGLATVAAIELPLFGPRPSVSAMSGTGSAIVAYTARIDPPPPRA